MDKELAFTIYGWYQISENEVQVFFNSTLPVTFQRKLNKDSPVTCKCTDKIHNDAIIVPKLCPVCVSGYIFTAISVGKHNIQLIARLVSDRKIKKVLKLECFTIQESSTTSPPPPSPPLVTASVNIINECGVRLDLSADVAATFRCRVNGGPWKMCELS